MFQIVRDLSFSLRALRRRPLFPIVAVTILALGLSATMAVFTYINGFYQPFPGVDADGLVRVFGVEDESPYVDISYLDFLDYSEADGAFEEIAATQPFYAASVRLETMTEVAFLEAVSGNAFSVLGVETAVGRGIRAEDDRPSADPVAVISHAWWQRSFNGDPSVIGSTIYLNFRPFTLVGVASPEFLGTTSGFRPDVWIPIAPFADRYVSWTRRSENRDLPLVRVYGRLRDGAGEEQGLAELTGMAAGLDDVYPRQTEPRLIRLAPATWIDPRSRLAEQPTVRLMIVAAGVLLLLVCANVANLLLSVAAGRQREMAMRASIGASPGRLVRQVLTENVLLSGIAGIIALALASPVSARLGSYFARPSVWGMDVPREASIDPKVVAFALAISIVTGLVAGLLPALRASSRNLADTLKSDTAASVGGTRRIWGRRLLGVHDVLVATQIALSVLLLVVAGLVVRTLLTVGNLDPGFSYDRLVVTHISTSSTTLEVEERERFFREVAERVAEEPWARTATVVDFPLLSPHMSAQLRLDGQTDPVPLVYSKVIPGFFEALDIGVLQGRSFVAGDTTGANDVAMVNESLARRFFPGEQPVGRRLWWPGAAEGEDRAFEIVGVVRDTKTRDYLADIEPTVYFSYPQFSYPTGSALMVSVAGDPGAAVPVLHRWLRDYEPHLAIVNVVPYTEVVRGYIYTQRMNAEMFSALAFLGLALAAVGIFSVMNLAVSRRTREIGIRMSIGAQRGDIGRLVIKRALIPVVIGLGVGLAASLAVTGLVRGLLFGVEPIDPISLAAGTVVLVVAALSAAYLPARRAATVDPMKALRLE
jgi:predicted permease